MKATVDPESINDLFIILCGIWVMFFKFGFTFFATGKTAKLSSANILFLSVADSFISLLAYWLHGYAFAFGSNNAFLGTNYFLTLDGVKFSHFFFNYARCAVATTIVSGAVVERAEPVGYLLSSYLLAGFVFPVASHWFWHSQGHFYLTGSSYPVKDYAGSGVVFGVGGTAALCANRIIGERSDSWHKFNKHGHSLPFTVLGACIQMVSFLGFTVGARGHITDAGDGQVAALTVVNTLLAGSSAGLYGLLFHRIRKDRYSVNSLIDSALTGMVAVCAGANSYFPALSLLCGTTAAFIYSAIYDLATRVKIDDPVNVVPIYLGGGFWGLLFAGFFAGEGDIGGQSQAIGHNAVAIAIVLSWTLGSMSPIYFVMRYVGILRVPDYIEKEGIDRLRHEQSYRPFKEPVEEVKVRVKSGEKDLLSHRLPPLKGETGHAKKKK